MSVTCDPTKNFIVFGHKESNIKLDFFEIICEKRQLFSSFDEKCFVFYGLIFNVQRTAFKTRV